MSREEDSVFVRNFMGVIALLFGVTIVLIIIALSLFQGDPERHAQLMRERAERNLEPPGELRLSGEPMPAIAQASGGEAAGGGEPRSGEQVVQQVCIACHQGGFMNAPAIGDKDAWAPRIEAGMATLVDHVANGFGNMPPQGGQASEEEIRAALTWMIEEETGLQIPQQ